MENHEVALLFEEVADLLEIQGANPFRIRAYRNAVRTIRDLPESLARILSDPERNLQDLGGIGKDLSVKIKTVLETGQLPLVEELRRQIPAGLRDLVNLPGLGPKRALLLHQKLRITSLEMLQSAAKQNQIRELPGFGAKTEERILQSLENIQETGRRTMFADAKLYADSILAYLKGLPGIGKIDVAGSFRRRKETVADLDLLVTCLNTDTVMDGLAAYSGVVEVLAVAQPK